MTTATDHTNTTTTDNDAFVDLRSGLAADMIDGRLRRAMRGRALSSYVLAFYLHELEESGKFRDLGYRCFAQYANQRLRLDPRRARELSRAGRALRKLTRIDRACREGRLCWTQTELLTHGVDECEQDDWIERAERASCLELKRMLQRHRKGLSVEKGADGGLPRAEFELQVTLPAALHDKLEVVREELMRTRGAIVDDSEVLAFVLEKHRVPKRDAQTEAQRAAASEQEQTPDWLRRKVIARDGCRCQACGTTENLHVHHIVFRSRGGLTGEANLVTVCLGCHGLIHDGRLFARGRAPDSVAFSDRKGEPLRGGPLGAPPRTVLRLLQPETREEADGGRPPRPGITDTPDCGAPTWDIPTGDTPTGGIPETITPEWFVANMHRFEPGRDGVWRPVRRKRSGKRRSTAVG